MKSGARDFTPTEWMIVTAARQVQDGQVLMVGTQWPIPVALLAKRLHAPRSVLCFEGGLILEDLPERIPLLTGDACLPSASSLTGDCLSALGAVLHKGLADLAILTAAHVDRFGNLNTTCVGPYDRPRFRFGGSGGACDFGSLAQRTLIVVEQNRIRFPAAVDFITTPGPSGGRENRRQTRESGPRPCAANGSRAEQSAPSLDVAYGDSDTPASRRCSTVVTTMGLFRCNEGSETVLAGFRSDLSPAQVQDQVQWKLRLSRDCGTLPDPTIDELRTLRRQVDPLGLYLSGRKQSPLSR